MNKIKKYILLRDRKKIIQMQKTYSVQKSGKTR